MFVPLTSPPLCRFRHRPPEPDIADVPARLTGTLTPTWRVFHMTVCVAGSSLASLSMPRWCTLVVTVCGFPADPCVTVTVEYPCHCDHDRNANWTVSL